MILCKVALGRVLPTTDGIPEVLDVETILPTGYHSLHVQSDLESEPWPSLARDGTPAYFTDTYLVPNTNLVLPTYVASYDTWTVGESAEPDSIPLEAKDRRRVDRVTVGEYLCQSRVQREPSELARGSQQVEKEHNAVIQQVSDLAESYDGLETQLKHFTQSLEEFRQKSHHRAEGFTSDLVQFASHYLQTAQTVDETSFQQTRFISDMNRLQEYHCYTEETMPYWQFFNSWRHCAKMGEVNQGNLAHLYERPALNQQAMALTEKNKRVVGMRRELMHQEAVIERLMDRLRERGALKPEDEELVDF
jgi:hypothetical protein